MSSLNALRKAAREIACSEMERDPVPDLIARRCSMVEGKPLTKRDIDWIEAEMPGLNARIYKDGSGSWATARINYWVSVSVDRETKEVTAQNWIGMGKEDTTGQLAKNRVSLYGAGVPQSASSSSVVIAKSVTGVARWPTLAELREQNARYYSARDERNAERQKAIATLERDPAPSVQTQAADAFDRVKVALAELAKATRNAPEVMRDQISDQIAKMLSEAPTESILWDIAYKARDIAYKARR